VINDQTMASVSTFARDPVTGAVAETSFALALAAQLGQALRQRRRLAVLLAGVDRFAAANERWGRSTADDMLAAIARRLGAILPIDGLLARYQSDQFAALCAVTSLEQAAALAHRLRRRVTDRPFFVAGVDDGPFFTVSVGVAVAPASVHARAPDIMKAAEVALQQAKDGGRNRIVVAGSDADATA
jgi:diguanylate cyclase (GGDEF)-like protein